MNPIDVLRQHIANVERSRQMDEEIREGIANLTEVTNRHLVKLIELFEAAVERPKRIEAAHSSAPPAAELPLEAALARIRACAGQEKMSAQIFDCILESLVTSNYRSISWGDRLLTLDKTGGFRANPVY